MINDLQFYTQTEQVFNAAIATNTTTYSAAIDTAEILACMFTFAATAYTDGTYAFTVEEADDVAFTVNVNEILPADDKWQGAKPGATPELTAVTADGDILNKIGVFSTRRYIRLKIVSTATTTGATINANAVQSLEVCQ